MTITRMSLAGDRRPSYSPKTRRVGLRRISRSCRSWCRSFCDVHHAKPESVCDRMAHWSFAAQNHVQLTAIEAMVLREGGLTSLALNCGSQQIENVIIIKHQ